MIPGLSAIPDSNVRANIDPVRHQCNVDVTVLQLLGNRQNVSLASSDGLESLTAREDEPTHLFE
jgi:hypothetical protein